jgi:hypothetical protein
MKLNRKEYQRQWLQKKLQDPVWREVYRAKNQANNRRWKERTQRLRVLYGWSSECRSVDGVPILFALFEAYLKYGTVGLKSQFGTHVSAMLKNVKALHEGRFFSHAKLWRKRLWLKQYESELMELAKRVLAVHVLRQVKRICSGMLEYNEKQRLRQLPSRIAALEKLLTILRP